MKKISLLTAILISINIVVGGGFFLSANNVFANSGRLAPLTWILCGLLLLPLVKVLASLSQRYPTAGGIYIYSKENLGNFWGFIAGWGYFVGTLAGNAIVLHEFSRVIKDLVFTPSLTSTISPLLYNFIFDAILVLLFILLNLLNITILEKIHVGFTVLKLIPIGLVVLSMFFFFSPANLFAAPILPMGLITTMPIVLFAYIGIEACCSITHTIEDGKKNASRAMLISLAIIIGIYSIVQLGLLGVVGIHSTNPFYDIIPHFTSNPAVIKWGNLIVKLSILSSYLGGFYGMFYANSWNLYALAKEKALVFHQPLTKLNKHNTPYGSIFFQGAIILTLLALTMQNSVMLMIMSGFGVVIAYILSVITYFVVESKIFIGTLALLGCCLLLVLCFNDLASAGLLYLIPFLGILASGVFLYRDSH